MRACSKAWLLTALCLLAGCAEASTPTAPTPTSQSILSLSEVLDSAAFKRGIAGLVDSGLAGGAPGKISVAYLVGGDSVSSIVPLWKVAGPFGDSVVALIKRVGRRTANPDLTDGVTVTTTVTPSPVITARASIRAIPILKNRDAIQTRLNTLGVVQGIRGSWVFWLRLDDTGVVERVEVRSETSDAQANKVIYDLMFSFSYSPASIDGFGIPVWVSQPVDIR